MEDKKAVNQIPLFEVESRELKYKEVAVKINSELSAREKKLARKLNVKVVKNETD